MDNIIVILNTAIISPQDVCAENIAATKSTLQVGTGLNWGISHHTWSQKTQENWFQQYNYKGDLPLGKDMDVTTLKHLGIF